MRLPVASSGVTEFQYACRDICGSLDVGGGPGTCAARLARYGYHVRLIAAATKP